MHAIKIFAIFQSNHVSWHSLKSPRTDERNVLLHKLNLLRNKMAIKNAQQNRIHVYTALLMLACYRVGPYSTEFK